MEKGFSHLLMLSSQNAVTAIYNTSLQICSDKYFAQQALQRGLEMYFLLQRFSFSRLLANAPHCAGHCAAHCEGPGREQRVMRPGW